MKTSRLKPLEHFNDGGGPLVTVILDGVGIGSRDERDGVYVAHTPVLDGFSGSHCSLN